MSNYKWVKMWDYYAELRKDDFSSFPSFEVNIIDPILKSKLEENQINVLKQNESYVLTTLDRKMIMITAPLYEYNSETDQYTFLSDEYTAEVIDPVEKYENIKRIYTRCIKAIYEEQKKIFEEQFDERSLDGITSVVTISSSFEKEPNYFYEKYVPRGYIKVCEKNCPFNNDRHEIVFMKKIDAKGQEITINVYDIYKGIVIGKGGMNIKSIAEKINAKRINVI